jgi:lysozyme
VKHRTINDKGLRKLKEWEGLRLKAYRDEAGVLTIGYGHTSAAGEPKVTAGMVITEQQAELILRQDIAKFENRVNQLVTVPLTENQFAALVSFDFNTGRLHKSQLLDKLNAGDYDAVPHELMKWVKTTDPTTGKKVTSRGLVNRRAAEAGLWASGTQIAGQNTPAIPVTPPVVNKESVTWGAGILATTGALFEGTGPVQWALAAVIAVSFAVGLFLFVQKRRAA